MSRPPDARQGTPDVVMVSPDHFGVDYEINPHMDATASVDPDRAADQWLALKSTYERLGHDVLVLDAVEGLPDMVFAANHGLAYDDGDPTVLLGRMRHEERAEEVAAVARQLRDSPLAVTGPTDAVFEGTGDAIPHPDPGTVWVGHGYRTERAAVDEVARRTGLDTVGLELVDDRFYHLDLCLVHLDADRALVHPDALAPESVARLREAYADLLPTPADEAATRMAGNAHCPDGETVVIHEGATETAALLRDEGFDVRPVDTSEFAKAGGSVYCLKLAVH